MVSSQVFDPTSTISILEARFDVAEPNISAWHRAATDDLTGCFNTDRWSTTGDAGCELRVAGPNGVCRQFVSAVAGADGLVLPEVQLENVPEQDSLAALRSRVGRERRSTHVAIDHAAARPPALRHDAAVARAGLRRRRGEAGT